MRILIIGQCSLHWGRMENGNIGNYYILEPLVRELHRVFPDAELVTTMQLTDEFKTREKISVIPMELYYGFNKNDLEIAQKEYEIAKSGNLKETTPYIDEVLKSDLVIDFSGDMWSKNADLAGSNRFIIGLYKDSIAQLLGKKTVLFSASPSPFDEKYLDFAKEVYSRFDLVTLREPKSETLLRDLGFDLSKTKTFACQSVLFEEGEKQNIRFNKPSVGFILCGWNMVKGPFNREDYEDNEFKNFIKTINYCTDYLGVDVYLISHSNGFELPPNFKLIHGRDYKLLERMYKLIENKRVHLLDGIYSPKQTKAIIKEFDMLISGRVHGAIAGLSSCVPTVIIDYGHEPKAHKLRGFAELFGIKDYVADPADYNDLRVKVENCFLSRDKIREHLKLKVLELKELAKQNIESIKEVL